MFWVVFSQMLALALLLLTGYGIARKEMADQHTMGHISKMINYIFNPMLMLSSCIGAIGKIDKVSWFMVFALSLVIFIVMIALSYVIAPLFTKAKGQKEMYQMMLIFGNFGFMGIPVVRGVYGEEYVVYVLAFILSFNIFFYTFAFALVEGRFSLASVKKMFNPGMIAAVITILIMIFEPPIPTFIATTVTYLGNVTSPMAMIAVGVTMANSDLKAIFTNNKIYVFTLLRSILIPLLAIPVVRMLPLDTTVIGICLIEIAMPIANMPLILGTERGMDCTDCSAGIIMTTLFSVLTIPVLVALV